MTRTAVRRHVDVSDGRLVIRKIVVEAPVCQPSQVEQVSACAEARDGHRVTDRLPGIGRARHALRERGLKLA